MLVGAPHAVNCEGIPPPAYIPPHPNLSPQSPPARPQLLAALHVTYSEPPSKPAATPISASAAVLQLLFLLVTNTGIVQTRIWGREFSFSNAMVHGLLFKWEDSAALKHHCGSCKRPLNHPGARASCFGKHSEPCVRYHQAMFMRLRGHTCTYCLTIEEAHYKRHIEIAEKVRGLYESCGEIDWTLIPSETCERGRARIPGKRQIVSNDGESDPSPTSDDTPTSRREKKNAKNLARAASRSRMITQEEAKYIDSVLHLADGVNDSEGPCNPEEIEEIERHLRYHAQVYNTQPDRRGLRNMAQFPDADVDFDAEMERILEILRITDLVQRNSRNRGLQGRDMKHFEALVEELKRTVVEDIVLVKKDILEIRMRRAGYMRYTNKAAVTHVEDRYIDKDWKTGEKINVNRSDSSGYNTPLDEIKMSYSEENVALAPQQLPRTHAPDRRHLETVHIRVSGEDGLHEAVIEPYNAPLVTLATNPTPNIKPISLKVFLDDASKCGARTINAGIGRTSKPQPVFNGWQTMTGSSKTTLHTETPTVSAESPRLLAGGRTYPPVLDRDSSSKRCRQPLAVKQQHTTKVEKSPFVQSPPNEAISLTRMPESFIDHAVDHITITLKTEPVLSHKKKAKKEREARRKARKVLVLGEIFDRSPDADTKVLVEDEVDLTTVKELSHRTSSECPNDENEVMESAGAYQTEDDSGENNFGLMKLDAVCSRRSAKVFPFEIPVTKHGKHVHWHRFTRNLIVDQPTTPLMVNWHTPHNGTPENAVHCAFERYSEPDCPFHDEFFDDATTCACCAYRKDMCHLTYPGIDECSFGPIDRLHGEKLMEMYKNDSRTQGRLMLVDDVLYDYLLMTAGAQCGHPISDNMPEALVQEYTEVFDNHKGPGPLIQQEQLYQRLAAKNMTLKHPVSSQLLHKMQLTFEPKDCTYTCYCHTKVVPGLKPEDTIECSHRDCANTFFHNACVKKRHHEKVTRWYCRGCSQNMKALARNTLHSVGDYDHDAEERYSCELRDQIFRKMMNIPDDVFERVKKRVQTMGGMNF